MTLDPWRTPVLISAAQCCEGTETVGPLDLAERAARDALDQAPGIADRIDQVEVVAILLGAGPAPASQLATRLKISPESCVTTTVGGNTPQWLVGRAADDIAAGNPATVLIAGAEALRSQAQGHTVVTPAPEVADEVVGDPRPGLSEAETAAGLMVPAQVYPLFESVLAHRAGRSFSEQRTALGQLMAPFTQVAARHPCAWFPRALTAHEIAEVGPENRVFAEPYTKRMNAFLKVDQGAALLVTSLGCARELGLEEQAVFIWSAADACDVWFPAARPDMGSSPGIAAAARASLTAAAIGIDDVEHLDLYSCFPCSVRMAADALGLTDADERKLTVTGGLPYFGGPGNNYTAHAIATMYELLKDGPGASTGLVSGLGWFVTKHSVGIYGSEPPPDGYERGDTDQDQAVIDASAVPVVMEAAGETATVEASTVIYDRAGTVRTVPVVARLPNGSRVVASATAQELAGVNLVGQRVRVDGRPPRFDAPESTDRLENTD